MTDEKRELALLFSSKVDRDDPFRDQTVHLSLGAECVTIVNDRQVRGISRADSGIGGCADLQVRALACTKRGVPQFEAETYGWSLEYREVFSIELHEAESMVRTLRAAHKRLEQYEKREGRPESFGAYVVRCARALGITRVIFRQGEHRGPSYDDSDWTFVALGEAQDRINHQVAQFFADQKPKEETAA